MRIVFVDPNCPQPYDSQRLATSGLGGTEATILRVARFLSASHDVSMLQHNRTVDVDEGALAIRSMDDIEDVVAQADHVVFVQKAQRLRALAPRTRARLWLWLHNYLEDEVPFFWTDHVMHRLGIICVSRTHADHTRGYLGRLPANRATLGWIGRAGICHLYNPVDVGATAARVEVCDPDKVVFFSSPHKGIEQVLARFRELHAARPRTRLHIADPGYLRKVDPHALDHAGIVKLGSLPHADVLRHVREAACVFYPQHKRPETFGLVYAEANAVGTPVLAHDFGSAREVLSPNNPPLDATRPTHVLARTLEWLDGDRPAVFADPRFTVDRVGASWSRFLSNPDEFMWRQRAGESG